jgi:hypothetical protein
MHETTMATLVTPRRATRQQPWSPANPANHFPLLTPPEESLPPTGEPRGVLCRELHLHQLPDFDISTGACQSTLLN